MPDKPAPPCPNDELRPPRAPAAVLCLLWRLDEAAERLGDFEEGFREEAERSGPAAARRWYTRQACKAVPAILRQSLWGGARMVLNYLKMARRSLLKRKAYSALNIVGLAVGLAACLLILTFIRHERSYDAFYKDSDRIVRIERRYLAPDGSTRGGFATLAPGFVPFFQRDVPGIEKAARLMRLKSFADTFVRAGDKSFREDRFFLAEADLMDILTLPFSEGDPKTALLNPNTVVLSESTARRYFGKEPALGRTILLDNAWLGSHPFRITGIFEDTPANSHVHFDLLGSLATVRSHPSLGDYIFGADSFLDNVTYVYARLAGNASLGSLQSAMPALLDRLVPPREQVRASQTDALFLRPLTEIHLDGRAGSELEPNGDRRTLGVLGAVALAILIIACINFTNLATAQASRRAREVGLRKIVGGHRRMLASQFLAESFVTVFLALLLAVILACLAWPAFGALTGRKIPVRALLSAGFWPMIGWVYLGTSLAAGLYPALFLSAFPPLSMLRNQMTRGAKGAFLRKTLVIVQFAASVVLIIGVGVIGRQMRFLRAADLGIDRDNVVILPVNAEIKAKWPQVRDALGTFAGVRAAALSMGGPSGELSNGTRLFGEVNGRPLLIPDIVLERIRASHEFFRTYGVPLVAGRDFSSEIPTDEGDAFILNESAVRLLGLPAPREAINMPIGVERNRPLGRVVGVVADFHYESMRSLIKPMIAFVPRNKNLLNRLSVRVAPGDPKPALDHIRTVLSRFCPGLPFDFDFLNDRLSALYRDDERMGKVLGAAGTLAVVVAVLGLFGLASFAAEQRSREIGIRRVLGASVPGLTAMFSRELEGWLFTANLVAWPTAFLIMKGWLESFAYRTPMSWTAFAGASLLMMALAWLTVAARSAFAAMANPAESIRRE